MTPRRELALAVVACAVASALALFAASRPWLVEVTPRPAPLPPISATRSGASLVPLLPAVALVALAGAGALLATRGRWVGAVLVAAGLTMAVTATGQVAHGGWPLLCVVAGAVITLVGGAALRRGRAWPRLGTRYDVRQQDAWSAIDAGNDPTGDESSQQGD